MNAVSAILAATIMAAIAMLHVYWAFGGTFAGGSAVPEVGGRKAFEPGRAMTLAVAVALGVAAVFVLGAGGLIEGPGTLLTLAGAAVGLVFLARAVGNFGTVGFFKKVRGTAFARNDSRIYSPLCLALAVLCFGALT